MSNNNKASISDEEKALEHDEKQKLEYNEKKAFEEQEAPVVFTPVDVELAEKQQDNERPDAISAIPDGGLTAWLQCVSSFSLFFNTWGIVNTFGK